MITLNKQALNTLSTLLPVLRRDVNEFGVIPFGAKMSDDAAKLINLLVQLGDITNAGHESVKSIANALLREEYKFVEVAA